MECEKLQHCDVWLAANQLRPTCGDLTIIPITRRRRSENRQHGFTTAAHFASHLVSSGESTKKDCRAKSVEAAQNALRSAAVPSIPITKLGAYFP
jgi:hypothetical protein